MATAAETAVREAKQFIGGTWTDAADGATFEDRDPYNGDVVAIVPAGGAEDARRAIDAASAAFPAWAASPPAERQRIFLKAADILESRRDEVVSILARETGSTFGFGMFQMHFVPGLFRQALNALYGVRNGPVLLRAGERRAERRRGGCGLEPPPAAAPPDAGRPERCRRDRSPPAGRRPGGRPRRGEIADQLERRPHRGS